MKILIAEDDAVSRRLLQATLTQWGYEVHPTADGQEAWEALQRPDAPRLAILDWMMPNLDGPAVCQKLRARPNAEPIYAILLTSRDNMQDLVQGLASGADDYITKPFERDELRARLQVGLRILELQQKLSDRVKELEAAFARIDRLHGLLPICAWCKKIRDDQNFWRNVEDYLGAHTATRFSHGICPECLEKAIETK